MKSKNTEETSSLWVLLALLSGIVKSWLIKDGVTSLVLDGKSFNNRSFFIQIGILAFLVIFTFALFLLILSILNSFFAVNERLQQLVYKLIFWFQFSLGSAPIIIGLFFLGSIQMLFLGIVGEYIGAIYTQSCTVHSL